MTDETSRLVAEGIAVNSTAFLDDSEEKVKTLGNPTEAALLLWLKGQQVNYLTLREEAPVVEQLTFSTERKYMATVVDSPALGKRILYVNILKVALLTVVTLLGLSIGSLLGGTAIVESIFMWDGVGKLAVDSIRMMDYPMIQAYVIWMAVIFVVINLITDILYNYLDPRIRIGKDIW